MTPAQLQDRLETRAGVSVARIQATGVELAAALCPSRDPSLISQWKSGSGPIAYVHQIVFAWESRGYDCTSILAGLVETQAEARGAVAMDPDALAREEQALDSDEDRTQTDYLTDVPGARAQWKESLARYVAFAMRAMRSMEVSR